MVEYNIKLMAKKLKYYNTYGKNYFFLDSLKASVGAIC